MRSLLFSKSSPPTSGEKTSQASTDNHLQHASKEKNVIGVVHQPLEGVQNEEQNGESPPGDVQSQIQREDEIVYPHGLKLATISTAVALSVFLVALVSLH
jgi:hypothetical protein